MHPVNHHLFVYGSLKRSFYNHDLIKEARFIGAARTASAAFTMGALEEKDTATGQIYSFPIVMESRPPAPCGHIEGEIYDHIDNDLLKKLDALEEVGSGLYERQRVEMSDGGTVWMYLFTGRDPQNRRVPDINPVAFDTANNTFTWLHKPGVTA